MKVITLDQAKRHIAVTNPAHDALVTECVEAAEDYAEQFMGRSLSPWVDDVTEAITTVPMSVQKAILLMAKDHFDFRQTAIAGTSTFSQSPAAENMLHFYRKGLGV